jgi:nitrogen fixation/metabolism regulation signal transduction histidine kinase
LNLEINDEQYLVYAVSSKSGNETNISAVSLKEKEIQWSFFNFFKLLIIHAIFILTFYLILLAIKFSKEKEKSYSFRAQLLVSFLLISIIPIIALAIFNRKNVNEKSLQLTKNALIEKVNLVENHFISQKIKNPARDLLTVSEKASDELKIYFTIKDGTEILFASPADYYSSGLLPSLMPVAAYDNLFNRGLREYFTTQKIDNFLYNVYYKKIDFEGKEYILEVNDLSNTITTTLSSIEVDVFLFGIYSFAILLIILTSTFLANKISSPLRRLTNATRSIALGDLGVPIELNGKGEIKELVTSFNFMKKMLKKNQDELAQLERETAWKEMAKQVAHEIKNPLTPMKLTLQQLITSYRDKASNFENLFEKVTSSVLNQIDTLSQIASEFSRFARMPSINLEKFDLVSILFEIKTLFEDEKLKTEIELHSDIAYIEADSSQFRRMLINFIRNSIQAQATQVNIVLKEINNEFVIKIIDNGKGINPEFKNKIFDENFTTKISGMGIGLKLSKRFLEGINGKIILESTSDKGTTFKLIIPKAE